MTLNEALTEEQKKAILLNAIKQLKEDVVEGRKQQEEEIIIPKTPEMYYGITLYDDPEGNSWSGFKVNYGTLTLIEKAMNAVATAFGESEVVFYANKIVIETPDNEDDIEIGTYHKI